MGCQPLDDVYELYLLGTLGREEAAEVSAHLERGCAYCLEHLREAAEVVSLLALHTPALRPSAGRKPALFERLKRR